MDQVIQKNVKDPELRKWIIPDFPTTTHEDEVVASVLLIGSMQKYFTFTFTLFLCCGLLPVTLFGEVDGHEAVLWHFLLAAVLRTFAATFTALEFDATKDFWQQTRHYSGGGSGLT
jgi:hypothetical protein